MGLIFLTLALLNVKCSLSNVTASTLAHVLYDDSSSLQTVYSSEDLLVLLPDYLIEGLEDNKTWEVVNRLCPSIQTCQQLEPGTDSREELTSDCCLKCQCDDECFAKGNCCHDKGALAQTVDGRTCVPVDLLIREGSYHTHLSRNSYLLKQTCVIALVDESIESRTRCMFPEEFNIDDITPVTSSITLVNYRNKFCAACNNDDVDLLPWEQELSCSHKNDLPPELFNGYLTKQERFDIIRARGMCSIKWTSFNDSNVTPCYRVTQLYSECPPYAPDRLKQLCSSDDSPFIPYLGLRYRYKNMFCLACNIMSFKEPLGVPYGRCIIWDLISLPIVSTFIAVMDMTGSSTDANGASERPLLPKCDNGLLYNEDLVCYF